MSPIRLLGQTDAQLVAAARAGDGLAFGTLYERHAARVAAVCRRRVAAHEVDDVVQEAFVRAHDRLLQLEDPDAFGGWVRAIAANACADLHRRRRTVPTDDFADLPDAAASADERLIATEDAAVVHAHLATLGERDRRALWLRDALQLPIAAVAAEMGTTEGSTRVLLTRARKRLRAAYVAVVAWLVAVGATARRRVAGLGDVAVAAAATGIVAAQVASSLLGGGTLGDRAPQPQALEAPAVATATPAGPERTSAAADGRVAVRPAPTPEAAVVPSAPAPDRPAGEDVAVDVDRRPADPAEEPDVALELEDGDDEAWFGVSLTSGIVDLVTDDEPSDGSSEDAGADDGDRGVCVVFCG